MSGERCGRRGVSELGFWVRIGGCRAGQVGCCGIELCNKYLPGHVSHPVLLPVFAYRPTPQRRQGVESDDQVPGKHPTQPDAVVMLPGAHDMQIEFSAAGNFPCEHAEQDEDPGDATHPEAQAVQLFASYVVENRPDAHGEHSRS